MGDLPAPFAPSPELLAAIKEARQAYRNMRDNPTLANWQELLTYDEILRQDGWFEHFVYDLFLADLEQNAGA